MKDPSESEDTGINRRTVLKSAAAVSGAGLVGMPGFSGSAVAQGSNTYSVRPFNGDKSVEDFYDWDNMDDYGNEGKYSARPELQEDGVSQLFLYTDDQDETYLVLIHGSPEAADEQPVTNKFQFSGLSGGEWVVKDDDPDKYSGSIDSYSDDEVTWDWGEPRTDGGAYGPLGDCSDLSIEITPPEEGIDGIHKWQLLTYDGEEDELVVDDTLDQNESVTVGCLCEVDLLAGQNIPVGTVTTDLNSDILTVTYQTDNNWYLAETHLEVVDDPVDFPTTQGGNPKVGQFSYGDTYSPGVQTDEFGVGVGNLSPPYLVAAHAVVYHVDCGTVGEPSFWATEINSKLGKTKDGEEIRDKYDDEEAVLGEPADEHDLDGDAILSLGFGGRATVEFGGPVYNTGGDRDLFIYETTGSSSSSWKNYPEEKAEIYVREVGSDEFVMAGEASNKDTVDGWEGLGTVGIPSDISAIEAVKIVDTTNPEIHDDNANGYDLNAVGADCIVDQEETAWGSGCEFTDNSNWAMYIEYDPHDSICGCGGGGNDSGD